MTELLSLYLLAEEENIMVDCYQLGKRAALSIMDRDGDCYIAIDPFRLESEMDEKVKLAHELGHCKTGSFYNQWAARDVRQKHENRADKWAVQHLVSEEALDDAVAEGHTEMWQLAEHFGVTEDFIRKVVCWYTNGNLAVD